MELLDRGVALLTTNLIHHEHYTILHTERVRGKEKGKR